jgi:sulfur-oxidizing protein SoxY
MRRRQFFTTGAIFSAYLSIWPSSLLAGWSGKNFQRCTIEQAFVSAFGAREPVRSDKITIVAPPVAADGSAVPVQVISSLKGEEIYLFVEKNITPLVFKCTLKGNALPWFSLNVKMKESSALYAVVREGGDYFMTSVHVDVLAQAC